MVRFKRIAVLIDAENAKLDCIGRAMNELENCGQILLKEAYGDWSKPHLKNWTTVCKALNIERVMQSSDSKGKNATDIALVIGAMDCLYKNKFDAFALISSDSDYAPLIHRLHKDAVNIIVVGKKDAAKALRKRCDKFISEEDLLRPIKNKSNSTIRIKTNSNIDTYIKQVYQDALEKNLDKKGWIIVDYIDDFIRKNNLGFSIKTTGSKSFTAYIKKNVNMYELKRTGTRKTVPCFCVIKK